MTLPVMFSDLPRNAQLALTIYDAVGPSKIQPVGGTTISLFGKHGVFRQVRYCFISCIYCRRGGLIMFLKGMLFIHLGLPTKFQMNIIHCYLYTAGVAQSV